MSPLSELKRLAKAGADGRNWYVDAERDIAELCQRRGWNRERFTGILAVTSPRVSVARNLRITLQFMQTGELLSNVMVTIRSGVTHYLNTGEIRGPKTGPFYAALLGDTSAVVLDVWMAKALDVEQSHFSNRQIRYACGLRVRQVARSLRWSPRDTQAAIWTGIVRQSGNTPGRFNPSREYANLLAWGGRFPDGPIEQRADVYGRFQPCLF
jgi:hypothetical protein